MFPIKGLSLAFQMAEEITATKLVILVGNYGWSKTMYEGERYFYGVGGCVVDLDDLRKTFSKSPDHHVIVGQQMETKADFLNFLSSAKKAFPNPSEVIFYYSGHGDSSQSRDGFTDELAVMNQYQSINIAKYEVATRIRTLFGKAIPKVYIFDCCRGGNKQSSISPDVNSMRPGRGQEIYINSTQPLCSSYMGNNGSTFTYYLNNRLRETFGGAFGKRRVPWNQMLNRIKADMIAMKVTPLTGQQTPHMHYVNETYEPLYVNGENPKAAAELYNSGWDNGLDFFYIEDSDKEEEEEEENLNMDEEEDRAQQDREAKEYEDEHIGEAEFDEDCARLDLYMQTDEEDEPTIVWEGKWDKDNTDEMYFRDQI
jgi:Caspase domain